MVAPPLDMPLCRHRRHACACDASFSLTNLPDCLCFCHSQMKLISAAAAFAYASASGLIATFALCDIISDFLDEFLETFV